MLLYLPTSYHILRKSRRTLEHLALPQTYWRNEIGATADELTLAILYPAPISMNWALGLFKHTLHVSRQSCRSKS